MTAPGSNRRFEPSDDRGSRRAAVWTRETIERSEIHPGAAIGTGDCPTRPLGEFQLKLTVATRAAPPHHRNDARSWSAGRMANALASKASARKGLGVRVP